MARNDDKASRILEAADALFGEVGFDGVSVRDVAQRAGVNKALVFYYFKGKDALFERVLERYYEAHRAALADAFSIDGSLRDRLHGLIDAYIDFIESHRHYPRLVQREVSRGGRDLEVVHKSLGALFEWFERALDELAPLEGPLSARHFFVTFSGAVINYFTYGEVLGRVWGSDPLSADGITERRAHLHWLVDTVVDRLAAAT